MISKVVSFTWKIPGTDFDVEVQAQVTLEPGVAPSLDEPGEPGGYTVEEINVVCGCGCRTLPCELWQKYEAEISQQAIEEFDEEE